MGPITQNKNILPNPQILIYIPKNSPLFPIELEIPPPPSKSQENPQNTKFKSNHVIKRPLTEHSCEFKFGCSPSQHAFEWRAMLAHSLPGFHWFAITQIARPLSQVNRVLEQ